ncbi:amyloid-beta A4 precursor protein-binding family A member 3 isoform X3 [Dipodomys merriami]|uniref:amyloid-beta A4 precursor protein-binding family A member 3 isoform X3 n=1 Tax=Dipodomys merriami TaxID=94247 RepID=UPI003855F13F
MEFLTTPQPSSGPPAMDLGEPRDSLVPSETRSPDNSRWNPQPGSPGLSQMDLDPSGVQDLVGQLENLPGDLVGLAPDGGPCPLHIATGHGLASQDKEDAHGLLSAEAGREDLLDLLQCEAGSSSQPGPQEPPQPAPRLLQPPGDPDGEPGPPEWTEQEDSRSSSSSPEPWLETVPLVTPEEPPAASAQSPETLASCPALQEVPGPCDHEDLMDGVIFGAKYLGSTQLVSEWNPTPSMRMAQAQEAVDRVKAPDGESQPMTEVDLFVSTKRVKVLTADSQEAMMDHALQTISYIADIGPVLVLMARRRLARRPGSQDRACCLYKMICHVFHSEDVCIEKLRGEGLGVALVESGWGSLLPTAVIANLMHGGPAERSGALSIGDRLTAINGASLVGLPLSACQAAVREVRPHTSVRLSIVHCPPVTTAIIRRPHSREQLGFCVEDGIICSLLRGGIAERGGIRVGHRIIEINGQSVVATPHERIIQLLTEAHNEVHIKTMPAATYRLLTGQEQPVYL